MIPAIAAAPRVAPMAAPVIIETHSASLLEHTPPASSLQKETVQSVSLLAQFTGYLSHPTNATHVDLVQLVVVLGQTKGVYTQPVVTSQVNDWQGSVLLQKLCCGACTQPKRGSQESKVQSIPSSQSIGLVKHAPVPESHLTISHLPLVATPEQSFMTVLHC
jgi:hypothetical protein